MDDVPEWLQDGFNLGYFSPDAEPGIPLAEPQLSAYLAAVTAGRQARADFDSQYAGPGIGPDVQGSQSWEDYEKELQDLLEPLFHKHMPHTEVEMPVGPPPAT